MNDNKKDIILDSANKMFTSKGFNGTSVGEIAKEAGLSKASLYYYYVSKDEILYELIKRTLIHSKSYLSEALSGSSEITDDIAKEFTNRIFKILDEEKDVFKIALIEELKTGSEKSVLSEISSSIFEEYEKMFEIPKENKALIFILAITAVIFYSLKNKIADNLDINTDDLDKIFESNFIEIAKNKAKNLKVRG